MNIGEAAEVFAHHIKAVIKMDTTSQEEIEAAVQAFRDAASQLNELNRRTIGQMRFGAANR